MVLLLSSACCNQSLTLELVQSYQSYRGRLLLIFCCAPSHERELTLLTIATVSRYDAVPVDSSI